VGLLRIDEFKSILSKKEKEANHNVFLWQLKATNKTTEQQHE
jgi:hypothetical protein